ncbi:hypothetical protein [Schumannella sp. 10F1B-5-1]|uniref:hypothetical protein n=1 Tax=Schumannella sp. 10F1B-5-1 TaxID=2590780 RepID=UPI0015E873D3|nr:hypothetical protein [Schumannella sp. 10F1B-5-1]
MTDPSRRDRRRPLELLGLSAIIAIVIGIIVWGGARNIETALIWAGISFIVVIVVVAMLVLATFRDTDAEGNSRRDDEGDGSPH